MCAWVWVCAVTVCSKEELQLCQCIANQEKDQYEELLFTMAKRASKEGEEVDADKPVIKKVRARPRRSAAFSPPRFLSSSVFHGLGRTPLLGVASKRVLTIINRTQVRASAHCR